jgi:phosphoglycolate phosphatase-like HAD superfamily hydrolase
MADAIVFFDIGDTLARASLLDGGERLELAVLPEVTASLTALRDLGVRMGVISDRGPVPELEVRRALDDAGLLIFLEPELLVFGRKHSTEIFRAAAGLAGPCERVVFVGENQAERDFASMAGFIVLPSPALVPAALKRATTA